MCCSRRNVQGRVVTDTKRCPKILPAEHWIFLEPRSFFSAVKCFSSRLFVSSCKNKFMGYIIFPFSSAFCYKTRPSTGSIIPLIFFASHIFFILKTTSQRRMEFLMALPRDRQAFREMNKFRSRWKLTDLFMTLLTTLFSS
jgi:hypothetical protein